MSHNSQTPGFICGFHFQDGDAKALTAGDSIAQKLLEEGWIWLHLALSDTRCQKWLQEELEINAEMAASFCRPASRQYMAEARDWLTGCVSDFQHEFDTHSASHAWLHILASSRILITGRGRAVQSAEHMRRDIAMGYLPQSPFELLGQLLTKYADTLDSILHRLLSELELIEDHVLEERHRGERRQLMLLRRETAQLHRHMRALRRALMIASRELKLKPQQLDAIVSRLSGHDQDFEALEARARFFHDEIDAKLAAETNRQLYILSALTALFLPPSLVAGLFGMNVQGSPLDGSGGGFWLAVGFCALSSIAVSMLLLRLNRR
jgi:zinc transporter